MSDPNQIEAWYSRSYKAKSIPVLFILQIPMVYMTYAAYGKIAAEGAFLFYLGCLFLAFMEFTIIIPGLIIIFNRKPALVISQNNLWLLEVGALDWESIQKIKVVSVPGDKTIRIFPKNKYILWRVPFLFRFQCWMNLSFTGHLASVPWNGLTISGEDFIKAVKERTSLPVE